MLKDLFRKKSISGILAEAKEKASGDIHSGGLQKTLTTRDLTAFGIAAIIGAGIFSTIGNAAASGGPGVAFLFIFTAIACGFSALCYAEFASMIPVSGSAYTYSYAAFGEIIAWIIGWDLLLEYAIGNIAVAISWSDYFTSLLGGLNIHIPEWLTMDFLTAKRGFAEVSQQLADNTPINQINSLKMEAYHAWLNAPMMGGFHFVIDFPAMMINLFITYLVYIGIKESRNASNIMVAVKLLVVVMVIIIGFFYIQPENWSPFAPNGISGILKGVSAVFFAYIGFDAISTTAEECKNPQKDLPRAIIYSLIICTVLYVLISLVLTGMVPYHELAVGDPLAFVFARINMHWFSGIIAFSAVVAMASVLLVFQMGQPRIWMSMSRDGLLPPIFSKIHPRFHTPSFATIVTGLLVGIPVLFLNLVEVTDLTSIGTLFAFVLVCGGVLILNNDPNTPERKFKVYYINGKWIVPLMFVTTWIFLYLFDDKSFMAFFRNMDLKDISLAGWDVFKHRIPLWIFIISSFFITYYSFKKNLSLIPVLGLTSCLYLMTELGITNWTRFVLWLLVGLVIYVFYGYRNSKLREKLFINK